MNILKKFKKDFEINGQTEKCSIIIKWDYEPHYPVAGDDFDFGDTFENASYAKRFEKGELVNVFIMVEVCYGMVVGSDSMGGCHISVSNFEDDIMELIEVYKMIDDSIEELVSNIEETYKKLKPFYMGA